METVITSDMPVSVSLHRAPTDKLYNSSNKISYMGMFQSQHHIYLPWTKYNSDGSAYSFQVHDGIEILYVTDGQGILHFADEDVLMKRGDICLINPYELHNFAFDRDCCERLCIVFFARPLLTGVYSTLPDAAEALITENVRLKRHVHCGEMFQPELEKILCDILKICGSDAPCMKLELHSALLQLIAYLLNKELYTHGKAEYPFIPTVLYKTLQYLDSHLYTDISSTDAARHLGYTNAYFCRMFKKYFGTTFTSYLHDTRIAEAQKRIMRNPYILITELSEQLGFNDPNYFSYLFRKNVGVSPSEFAKKYRAK